MSGHAHKRARTATSPSVDEPSVTGDDPRDEPSSDPHDEPSSGTVTLDALMRLVRELGANMDSKFSTMDSKFSKLEAEISTIKKDVQDLRKSQAQAETSFNALVESVAALQCKDYATALWKVMIPDRANPVSRTFLEDTATAAAFVTYRRKLKEYEELWKKHEGICDKDMMNPTSIEFNGLGFAHADSDEFGAVSLESPVEEVAGVEGSSNIVNQGGFGRVTFAAHGFPADKPANCIVLLEVTTARVAFDDTIKIITKNTPNSSLALCKKIFQMERQLAFLFSYYKKPVHVVAALALRHKAGNLEFKAKAVRLVLTNFRKELPLLCQLLESKLGGVSCFQVI